MRKLLAMEPPTATAATWLLATGWRRWGPLDDDAIPGPQRAPRAAPG